MTRRFLTTAFLALPLLAAPLAAQDDDTSTLWVTELKVRAALLEKAGDKALPITVTMDRTTAILTGEVDSIVTQELAKEVALSVEGVAKVENRLRVAGEKKSSEMSSADVEKKAAQELGDTRLEGSVKIALFKEIGSRARKIEVEAVQGTVSLRGVVPDEARHQIVLSTVKEMKDVKRVVDLLKVGG